MKKRLLFGLLLAVLVMIGTATLAEEETEIGYDDIPKGTLEALEANPNQKLALRTGPGTKYSEVFSIAAGSVEDFVVFQQEKGGSAIWGMVEFTCRYGRYRAYTGMKRMDTSADVPLGNVDGYVCHIGREDTAAYFGPGKDYVRHETLVPAGTQITVYHEENGYVMADLVMPDAKDDQYDEDEKQLTRAWIGVEALAGYGD